MGLKIAEVLIAGTSLGCMWALLSVSFAVVLEATKVWNFASAGVYTLVAYLVWYLVSHGSPILVAALAGLVLCAILMIGADLAVHAPLRRRNATNEIVIIGSITTTILISALIGMIIGSRPYAYPSRVLGGSFHLGNLVIVTWAVVAVVVTIVTLIIISLILHRTKLGRMIRGYGDNADLSRVQGVRAWQPHQSAYVLGSVAIVPAAILVGMHDGVSPNMGLTALLIASAAAVMGGVGRMWAAAAGGLFLGIATAVPQLWLSPAWQSPIAFGIFVVAIIIKPRGLFAGRTKV